MAVSSKNPELKRDVEFGLNRAENHVEMIYNSRIYFGKVWPLSIKQNLMRLYLLHVRDSKAVYTENTQVAEILKQI